MPADSNAFVAWEEHIVNPEKGSRQVHFFLKKESGDQVLAVVGTERSIRHMLYAVSDEYMKAFGCDGSIHAGTKWRTRRDTVDWLTSIVSSLKVALITTLMPLVMVHPKNRVDVPPPPRHISHCLMELLGSAPG